jgi:hypothetical protein
MVDYICVDDYADLIIDYVSLDPICTPMRFTELDIEIDGKRTLASTL